MRRESMCRITAIVFFAFASRVQADKLVPRYPDKLVDTLVNELFDLGFKPSFVMRTPQAALQSIRPKHDAAHVPMRPAATVREDAAPASAAAPNFARRGVMLGVGGAAVATFLQDAKAEGVLEG